MNKYLVGLVLILGLAVAILGGKISKEIDRANRMTVNYQKAEDKNKSLELSYNELQESTSNRINKLTDSLDIKPKQVTKYVKLEVHDTIEKPVITNVTKIDSNTYNFSRDTGCFKIKGKVSLLDSMPIVTITKLEYNNTIEYIVYLERKQWEWWIIKSRLFGRKEAKLETISTCGESTVEEVKLIKN